MIVFFDYRFGLIIGDFLITRADAAKSVTFCPQHKGRENPIPNV